MYNNALMFAQALNITSPWFVKEVDFQLEKGELHVHIDFFTGSTFACKKCNDGGHKAYDTEEKTWRHLNFFQYKAYIHCRTPRSNCKIHGPLMVDVPWGREGSNFTMLFEAFIMALVNCMPVSAVAKIVDEHDTKLWRVVHHYVDVARSKEDFSDVTKVGVDETSCKKGHNYISIFVDLLKTKVLYITEGKDSSTVERFKQDLEVHNGIPTNLTDFSCDMSAAFLKGINENFSWVDITLDKFHVMQLMNKALDTVRREEQKNHSAELKYTRYIWLKNRSNLTAKQIEKLDSLSNSNLKTGRAYRIKLALQEVYNIPTKNEAVQALEKWYQWAIRSQLEPIKDMAKTVKRHWQGICNYFDSRLTNAALEGINSTVQSIKRRARGFRSTENFKTIIYLVLGQLKLN